jgi:membrane protein DedA with SNARE-associated domain/rhodanese-related sulfurtransferase
MESLASAIAQYGYSILFAWAFLEAVGVPVPAALALLISGGASAHGPMQPGLTIGIALTAVLLGDSIMFWMGRKTGWWLLGKLCRLAINPDSCILGSADAFFKRGRTVLLFAKFLPGIGTLAAPLAGSMNMSVRQFFSFDLGGATLYVLAYWGTGYLFGDLLGPIVKKYVLFGHYLADLIVLLLAAYLVYRGALAFRERKRGPVPVMQALDVEREIDSVAIFDVRSHGYYDRDAMRIRGSVRLEPNALNQPASQLPERLPRDKKIVLYCTCLGEATARHVARSLAEKGFPVWVIEGGLRAWKKAGLQLEPVPQDEVINLPSFVSS